MRKLNVNQFFSLNFLLFVVFYANSVIAFTEEKVIIEKAVRKNQSIDIHVSGKLSRKTTMRMAFNIDGLVESVLVNPGDRFVKNQVLARLNESEIKAQVIHAKSAYDSAFNDWQRAKNLFDKSLIPQSQLQHQKALLDGAGSTLETVQFNQDMATIKATVNGEVLEKYIEENELVTAKQTAFLVSVNAHGWVVSVEIPDHQVVRLNLGDKAEVRFSAYPDKSYSGKVSEISAKSNNHSGLFSVEVMLDSFEDNFRSGYLASVDILPESEEKLTFINLDSVITVKDNQAMFFAYDELTKKIKKYFTKIQFISENSIVSNENLSEVSYVVRNASIDLKDGELVQAFPIAMAK